MHTITMTRKLQNEVADLFGNANFFKLNVNQIGSSQTFTVIWGGLEIPPFKSRKLAHEWVQSKIDIRRSA